MLLLLKLKIKLVAKTLLIACLLYPIPVSGQSFTGLTTNYDGSILYFASSARQTGTTQTFHSKIYQWDLFGNVHIAVEQPDTGDDDACTGSKFYDLVGPQLSSDGATLAYTGTRHLPAPARFCSYIELSQGVVLRPGKAPVTIPGAVSLSPTGRYAIGSPFGSAESGYHSLTELDLGIATLIAGSVNPIPQQVTNIGTVLTLYDQAIVLTGPNGATQVIPTQPSLNQAVIDQAGKTVYYATRLQPFSPGAQLFSVDLANGKETRLDLDAGISSLSVTADGQTVLYQSTTGLRAVNLLSGTPRTINTNHYLQVVISGDGRIGYGVTTQGGIQRIDILTGTVALVTEGAPVPIARLASTDAVTEIATGSVVYIYNETGAPISVVSVCGRLPQTVASLSPTNFQIPFDQPEGSCEVITGSGAYQSSLEFQIYTVYPRYLAFGAFTHSNFQAVTNGSPASPGEIIIAHMTGLGPLDDRNLLKQPLSCSLDGVTADILYAGGAPGYPGIYQVNLRLPTPKIQPARLFCGFPGFVNAAASLPVF